jgi:hypothetical protein
MYLYLPLMLFMTPLVGILSLILYFYFSKIKYYIKYYLFLVGLFYVRHNVIIYIIFSIMYVFGINYQGIIFLFHQTMPMPMGMVNCLSDIYIPITEVINTSETLLCSSEGGSSPDSTPSPSPVKSAFNSSIELLPVRPSGELANLFDQIMTHHGFTAHGVFSLFPSLQDSLLAQGKPKSAVNSITSYELMGHKYEYNYRESCHKLSMYGQQERLDFIQANDHWFTHMRNFSLTKLDFKDWYTVNIDNISSGNIRDDE